MGSTSDLTPPDLFADNNVFCVTLHHKYIYTKEQKLWLDAFEAFNLSREQKTILLLGYNGHIISPKEIWDAVGIVDTEYYRQLLVSLLQLGIVERVTSKAAASNLAKKKKIPVKHVPRFAIRVPGASLTRTADRAKSQGTTDDTNLKPIANIEDIEDALDDKSEYARLYVANLPYECDEASVSAALARYGSIADVHIPRDHVSNRTKGYGFVEFDESASAAKAISDSGKIALGGRQLQIRPAQPRPKPVPSAPSGHQLRSPIPRRRRS